MKKNFRAGFTLIELFLVIAVIVILSGVLTVAGEQTVASTEADSIINNMRILKTAALEWLADYGDYVNLDNHSVTYPVPAIRVATTASDSDKYRIQDLMSDVDGRASMMKYVKITSKLFTLSNGDELPKEDEYAITDAGKSKSKWYVVYKPGENKHSERVMKKMQDRARENHLYKDSLEYYTADAKPNYVYMEIINLDN